MEVSLKKEQKPQKDRMDEAQRLADRTAAIKGTYKMAYVDKLYIDPDTIPYGWEYFWGRQSYRGHQDNPRMAYLGRRGWTAVPPERHPELCVGDALSGESDRNYIYNDGLILLERPKEFGDMERDAIAKHNLSLERDMPGKADFMNESAIPVRFLADPKPTRGPQSF